MILKIETFRILSAAFLKTHSFWKSIDLALSIIRASFISSYNISKSIFDDWSHHSTKCTLLSVRIILSFWSVLFTSHVISVITTIILVLICHNTWCDECDVWFFNQRWMSIRKNTNQCDFIRFSVREVFRYILRKSLTIVNKWNLFFHYLVWLCDDEIWNSFNCF